MADHSMIAFRPAVVIFIRTRFGRPGRPAPVGVVREKAERAQMLIAQGRHAQRSPFPTGLGQGA
jgi:hypothetical protein